MVWRLQIQSDDAVAIGLYYNKFHLPDNSRLYIYSADYKHVISYTNEENPESYYSTRPVKGDNIILEYHQPLSVTEEAEISITEVAYFYRDMYFNNDTSTKTLNSGICFFSGRLVYRT